MGGQDRLVNISQDIQAFGISPQIFFSIPPVRDIPDNREDFLLPADDQPSLVKSRATRIWNLVFENLNFTGFQG